MNKPKWWTESFEQMKSPLEKFQYLTGLSDLSWEDCQDAWFESKKLMPEVAAEVERLKAENTQMKAEWNQAAKLSVADRLADADTIRRLRDENWRLIKQLDFNSDLRALSEEKHWTERRRLEAEILGYIETANICSKEKAEALEQCGQLQAENAKMRAVVDWARCEVDMMDCRHDEDCDHCVGIQILAELDGGGNES